MHISNLLITLSFITSFATAQLVSINGGDAWGRYTTPRSREFNFCNPKGVHRYVTAVPASASPSVKAWCAGQTLTVDKATAKVTSTKTVTSAAKATGKRVTKTKFRTEAGVTKTLIKGTKTVTVHKKSASATTPGVNISVGADSARAVKRSLADPTEEKIHIKRVMTSGTPHAAGRPSKWTKFSDAVVAQICNCLGSPWKTITASALTTSTIWKTHTKFTTATGAATAAAVTTTVEVTVKGNGTATVGVVATVSI
ncbi:hypothetical protein AA313_de0206091 [Arthrobotrys entomopaga]|nr:hypothetical protein AA313_de0206091 [Arthrobotrys entomopaga]